jgi:hypothetical protein
MRQKSEYFIIGVLTGIVIGGGCCSRRQAAPVRESVSPMRLSGPPMWRVP